MKSFSLLRPEIRRALSAFGYKRPTEIQEIAIPRILEGKNALLIAPTGVGKTEAAVLPVFHRYLEFREKEEKKQRGIGIIYITPLRALNRDLLERMERWSAELGLSIAVRHGDTSKYMRRKQALEPPEMLITTPETLQAILPGKVMRRHLRGVRFAVVDEIHELAEDKRGAQLSVALERLTGRIASYGGNPEFQRIGLSATIGSPEKVAKFLAMGREVEILRVSAAKEIEIRVERPRASKIDGEIAEKTYSSIGASARLRRISQLVGEHNSTLIFVNTREMAETLASRANILDMGAAIHHSSLAQDVRIAAEREFKEEKHRALICTSSLELGIDIGSIDLVVQYMSPRQVTRLLQRIGRSGHRIGGKSKGVIIATDADDVMESLVIAQRALKEQLEDVEIPEKPYDVLAHQLVGLALDFGRVAKEDAFRLVKRSYVYRDLDRVEFGNVLELMSALRLLWSEGEHFGSTRLSRDYYFENLSTIPDERSYYVKDLATQRNVGVLDEAFVVHNATPGNLIIFKGTPWRVLSMDEKELVVEQADLAPGVIPSWSGEEIPVPREVARQVGMLRRMLAQGDVLLDGYPSDNYTKRLAASRVRRHVRKGLPVPDDGKVLVELFENFVVIHAPFGTRINQALGRVFSTLLTSKLGASVALQSDAYRIILQSPVKLAEEDIRVLFSIDPELMEPLLSKSLKRTSLFKWKFVCVAKRFGVISKDASYTSTGLGKIIDSYEDSPIYAETLKEIFKENLDLKGAADVLQELKNGGLELALLELDAPSPIAELGLGGYGEVVVPERAERVIIKAIKRRIMERRVELFCLYCARGSISMRIKNFPEDVICPECGARMLAVLKEADAGGLKSLYRRFKSGDALNEAERHEIKRLQTAASLFLSYGRSALIAMGGRGIGAEVAKRVLQQARDEESLYKSIMKAERDYARTRQFWD